MNFPQKKDSFKNLPNYLTLFRVAVIPLLFLLFHFEVRKTNLICAFLFTIAALSDWLDGFLARRYNWETKLGALLDPAADKMLSAAAIILLACYGRMWSWVAGIFLCREISISNLRLIACQQGITINVNGWGKLKTFALDVAIVCLFVDEALFGWPFKEVGMITLWCALALSLISAIMYGRTFYQKVLVS